MFIPVARRYRLDGAAALAGGGVVLRRDMLDAIRTSTELLAAARGEGLLLREQARGEALEIVEGARREACALAFEAQKAVWLSAADLLGQIEAQRAELLEQAGAMLERIARAGLERLLLDVPADWPASSSVRLVLLAWRRQQGAQDGLLRVHPEDAAALPAAMLEGKYWRCVADASLEPGTCVLSLGDNDIIASYGANVRSLVAAMGA